MASAPFLAKVPRKYLQDPEERRFWEYLIDHLGGLGGQSLDDIEDSDSALLAAINGASSSASSSFSRNNQIRVSGGTHFATDGDYITATNGPTIILPDNPSNNDSVRVLQGDNNTTTIRSNNKNIVDTSEIFITIQSSAYTLLYTVSNDYWDVL